jgi:hypothetical protein
MLWYFLEKPLLSIHSIHLGKNALLYICNMLVTFWNKLQLTSFLMSVHLSTNITLPSTVNFSDMDYNTHTQNFVPHCIYNMVVLHNSRQTQKPKPNQYS